MVWTYEWDTLVAAFEASRYKVKDCTKEPSVGINATTDEQGNYYLHQKKSIESVVKAAKVSGAKVQKLPYPLDELSLSKADNAKKILMNVAATLPQYVSSGS